jgi:transcriptional regulator with XRE-family HTH domain
MSINQRIKQIRLALKLSQAKFAKDILISNGYIASIELENRKVNDRIVKLICTVYGVSEDWLKTGKGEMFMPVTNKNLEKVIACFIKLTPMFQDYMLAQIEQLLDLQTLALHDKCAETPGEVKQN